MRTSSRTDVTARANEPGAPRRRRVREDTKAFFLDQAALVAVDRLVTGGGELGNPLAGIRIKDVLEAINARAGGSGTTPMTSGSVYQIWSDQAAFQAELLEHVMNRISTPGAREIEQRAFEMVAAGAPADDIFRMVSDADFAATADAPELFLALGLGALAPASLVREAQQFANTAYVSTTEHLLTTLLRYAGRRLQPGCTVDDLIWATEALTVGYLLRWRTHPEISTAVDDVGTSARARAYLGLVHAFTEPTGDRR